jgi:hypothetical protein
MLRTRTLHTALGTLILLTSLLTSHLEGQTIPSPYRFIETAQEAGAFLGTFQGSSGEFGLGPKGGVLVGVRYGLDISGPVGVEGAFSYLPTTRDVMDPRRAPAERARGEADVTILLAEARLRFSLTGRRTWHSLNPFLFAGAGGAFDVAGAPEFDQQLREEDRFDFGFAFAGVLGGGTRWLISERLLLRADAQLALWQLPTPDGYQDETLGLGAVPTGEWANNGMFTLGIAYRF